ncbi:ANK-REP-region domain-containing protein [Favolaschia claudopus]|uniref:ANK-REP-region domain-containing protein n=1 Tax=Favolaschia claudopus TaxID=2862362 RepID=A0AAW0BDZ2_9AGAR
MDVDYLAELPPELILFLPPLLDIASLNALVSTCRRLYAILQPTLQPEFDRRLTPEVGQELLRNNKLLPCTVARILAPPFSINPTPDDCWGYGTALHFAHDIEIAKLLLDAGADIEATWSCWEYCPLYLAASENNIGMVKLLLDRGASIDTLCGDMNSGYFETALHLVSSSTDFNPTSMIKVLLEHGANAEERGHFGTALGFAVHHGNLEGAKVLLANGADATVIVPLFLGDGMLPALHKSTLLHVAMELVHTWQDEPRWSGLPLNETQKGIMALLLAHGASKQATMDIITTHAAQLARAVGRSEQEYLQIIEGMLKEAEDFTGCR